MSQAVNDAADRCRHPPSTFLSAVAIESRTAWECFVAVPTVRPIQLDRFADPVGLLKELRQQAVEPQIR